MKVLPLLCIWKEKPVEKPVFERAAAPSQNISAAVSITLVCCRLKEDHLSKLKALQEAHNQLLAELAAQQEDSTQLLHTRDQLGKVSAR